MRVPKDRKDPYEGWTDEELGNHAVQNDPTGRPLFEMIRRLKDSNLEQQRATNRLTWVMVVLTLAILLLTAVMAAPLIHKIFNFYFPTQP